MSTNRNRTLSEKKSPTKKSSEKKPPTEKSSKAVAPPEPTPMQRSASPEEQTQVQVAQQQAVQQRARAGIAVLKQRFAETDVEMTIAQAECAQLVQQNQLLQQENDRLKEELAGLLESEDSKKDNPSTEPEAEGA